VNWSELSFPKSNIPPSAVLAMAASKLSRIDGLQCDVYLALFGAPPTHVSGFLVTRAEKIDQIIAFCPMPDWLNPMTTVWREELMRQLSIAARIASEPENAASAVDAVWLGDYPERGVPYWLYGLSCIPLAKHWTGIFLRPRPFCPSLFEHMAKQPEARHWLAAQQRSRE